MSKFFLACLFLALPCLYQCYDPSDQKLSEVLLSPGTFEAFYPPGEAQGSARAPHSHGSFFKHRNPALVGVKNAAAYGFRFDGKRRFNFD